MPAVKIFLPTPKEFLQAATLTDEEATDIKRRALREAHSQVLRQQKDKPDQLSDKFVDYRFKVDWESKEMPLGVVAGTDYDYFGAAIRDCIRLFTTWGFPATADPDAPGRRVAGAIPGDPAYNRSFQVWQNGVPVSNYDALTGPWVDFGPTVDYALFLEKSATRPTNNLDAPLLRGVGVLHAIAARLSRKYSRVHKIFAHTQMPDSSMAKERWRRLKSKGVPGQGVNSKIELFPVIRIVHRHYR